MEETVRDRITLLIKDGNSSINSISNGDKAFQRRLNRQINEGASVTFETISSILKVFPNISAEWLIRGEGPMLKSENPQPVINYEHKGIPFYSELPVSAGTLEVILQDSEPAGFIDLPGITATALFPVVGCSMKPEINPGDVIGITQLDSWERLDPDKIYLVITHEDRMIKHLAIDEEDNSILWCLSPNYPKFKINKSDIKYIYKVSFCGKLL